MARASTSTLLSLDRYAAILGIAPVHFSGAAIPGTSPVVFPLSGSCSNIWPQYSWQASDQVSREDLARAIHNAEMDIRRELGYSPAPEWIAQDVHRWPRQLRPEWQPYALNANGHGIGFKTTWGKVIEAGRRATTLIDTPTTGAGELVYSDEDGDGFYETATITVSTSLTSAEECEVKVYFEGRAAAPEWEIRPLKSVTISSGTLTIVADSWLFIDPDLWEAFPTDDGFAAINITGTNNFVDSVDVYREYTDHTVASAQFLWERSGISTIGFINGVLCNDCGGSGCTVCGMPTQDGCLSIRNAELGIVAPSPATYDEDSGQWNAAAYTQCDAPAQVKMWYKAGEIDDRMLSGATCEPLSEYWAQTIAMLATARLERPLCACNNVTALANDWRKDLSETTSSVSYFTPSDVIGNPFGTRKGEVMAWQRVLREYDKPSVVGGAV
jgi:hypothetical protein